MPDCLEHATFNELLQEMKGRCSDFALYAETSTLEGGEQSYCTLVQGDVFRLNTTVRWRLLPAIRQQYDEMMEAEGEHDDGDRTESG